MAWFIDGVLAFVTMLLVTAVVLRVSRHSIAVAWRRPISVYAAKSIGGDSWRTPSSEPFCRLFLQNRETIALDGNFALQIEILRLGGHFHNRPRVFAGPEDFSLIVQPGGTEGGEVALISFRTMPAAATWVIEWRLDLRSRVRVRILEKDEISRTGQRSRLPAIDSKPIVIEEGAVPGSGGGVSLGVLNLVACVALGISAYELMFSEYIAELLGTPAKWEPVRWSYALIVGSVLVAYFFVRRMPAPMLQGFWTPSPMADLSVEIAGPPRLSTAPDAASSTATPGAPLIVNPEKPDFAEKRPPASR